MIPDKTGPYIAKLLDHLPGMVYQGLPDKQHKLTFVSDGCQELTGYTAEELTGEMAFLEVVHPEDRRKVGRSIEEASRRGRPFDSVYRLVMAGGETRWVRDRGQLVFTSDKVQPTLTGLIIDATEYVQSRQQLEQEMADSQRKLSVLYDILEPSSKPIDLQSVLTQSLKRVMVATRVKAGFIHLRDKSGKALRLVVQQGLPRTIGGRISAIPAKHELFARIVQDRQSLFIADISLDPQAAFLAKGRLKVYAGVPIVRGRRVWGTLSLLDLDPSLLGAEEIALLTFAGEAMGIVVENARLRRQAERLLVVQERNRLARELHDSVTQSLYSLTLFAEASRRTAQAGRYEETDEYLAKISETGQQALKEMRLLLHRLRPSILAKEGLARALQHRLNAVEGRAGVKHQLFVQGEARLSPALEEALYLIAQEALNNALKHAMATEVVVRFRALDDRLVQIEVEDNGHGFDAEDTAESDGLGLISMRERVEQFAGQLEIRSVPGEGTLVKAKLTDTGAGMERQGRFGIEDLP